MRRTFAWIVTATFLAAATPMTALAGQVTVKPNPVRQNQKITVKAKDCVSGPNWEAVVVIGIVNKHGKLKYQAHIPADDDGVTKKKIRIKRKNFPPGDYVVYVDCVHQLDDGTDEIWYQTEHELKVKKRA